MPTAETSSRIPDQELPELLALIEQSDSVELKLTVAESDRRSAVEALGMDPLDAHLRQVYFFDTPDLALDRAGIVVRARRVQRKRDDVVVKLRPLVPADVARATRRSSAFVVEVDAMPGGYVCSATLKAKASAPSVREVALGELPIRKLFSKEQRTFFSAHAPDELALNELSVLGPIFVLKQNFEPKELGRRMVAELWFYPDGSRILELSTKCTATNAFQVAAEARGFLADKGVSLNGRQETKTKAALTYFSKQLRAAAAAA